MQQAPPVPIRQCPSCGQSYREDIAHVCPVNVVTLPGPPEPELIQQTRQAREDERVGTVLGERYELVARLGQGGMGVVYKARHIVLESPLAVKILLGKLDAEVQHRFLREAKLASKVNHPNTVHVSDFGVLGDGRNYLVMELLSGPTLAQTLAGGRLDPLRALEIAVQIARGLSAVHGAGIVHRDLSML